MPRLLTDLREALRVAKQESGGHHRKEKKSSLAPVIGLVVGLALLIIILGAVLYRMCLRPEVKPPQPVLPPVMRVGPGKPGMPVKPAETTTAAKIPATGQAAAGGPFPADMESALLAAMRQLNGGQADGLRLQAQRLQTGLDSGRRDSLLAPVAGCRGSLGVRPRGRGRTVLEGLRNQLVTAAPEGRDFRAFAQLAARYL